MLSWDRTLLAVAAVVVAVLALQELWLDLTCAVAAYAAAGYLLSGRRAST